MECYQWINGLSNEYSETVGFEGIIKKKVMGKG